jgi:CheY-like chemotaxis protein/anti-sigma regulatory factor (Ser/Thr protein kinase)
MSMRAGDHAVVSDELLLHQLLSNLVSNAIRYTNSGTVFVGCRRRQDTVVIEVRDSGIGIPADQQAEIFEEFYQIDNPARDRRRGLGLGLAIVARIARILDTTVKVRSAPDRGSVFSLRLPRARAAPGGARLDAAKPALIAESNAIVNVIVVDDDPLVLTANRGVFEDMRCSVETVSDGEHAAAALESLEGKPALVLCDLWLSNGESGVAVLQHLASLTSASFYGIVISGDTRPETIQSVKTAGYSLLHKPVAASKLRAVLMQFESKVRTARPADDDEDIAG